MSRKTKTTPAEQPSPLSDAERVTRYVAWVRALTEQVGCVELELSNPDSPLARAIGADAAGVANNLGRASDFLNDAVPRPHVERPAFLD